MHQTKIAVETKCNKHVKMLNIRSLKNKSFLINDLITTNNLNFMFLNETWLEDSCNATVLNETAPPSFNLISVCVIWSVFVFWIPKYCAERCSTHSVYHHLQASKILSSLCWRVHRTVINDFLRVWLFCYCRGF